MANLIWTERPIGAPSAFGQVTPQPPLVQFVESPYGAPSPLGQVTPAAPLVQFVEKKEKSRDDEEPLVRPARPKAANRFSFLNEIKDIVKDELKEKRGKAPITNEGALLLEEILINIIGRVCQSASQMSKRITADSLKNAFLVEFKSRKLQSILDVAGTAAAVKINEALEQSEAVKKSTNAKARKAVFTHGPNSVVKIHIAPSRVKHYMVEKSPGCRSMSHDSSAYLAAALHEIVKQIINAADDYMESKSTRISVADIRRVIERHDVLRYVVNSSQILRYGGEQVAMAPAKKRRRKSSD